MRTTVPTPDVAIDATCSGTPRQMGTSQGQQLGERIRVAEEILMSLEAFQLQRPFWMPTFLFRKLSEIKSRRFLRAGLIAESPATLERLQAIADAAGVTRDALFLLNAMEAVLSDLSRTSLMPVTPACSALAATGPATPDGHPMLVHNFDYLKSVRPLYMLRDCRPSGGMRSLEFTAAPLCGTIDGLNEAGLCITYNYGYARNGRSPAPTLSMRIAEVLGRCRTVSEAVESLTQSSRWGGGLLMLGDATGKIASLEIASTRWSVVEPPAERPCVFHTNRFQTTTLREVEIAESAHYSQHAPAALRGRRIHQSADVRHERLAQLVAQHTVLDPEALTGIMSDHGPDGIPSADSVCMHSDYWHTTACLQLFPAERRLRVAYDSACNARFVDFQL